MRSSLISQDFMIETHPAWPQLQALAKQQGKNHFVLLGELLKKLAEDTKAPFLSYLNRNLFFYPDLHGNRSPLARSDMRGMYDGMALDKTLTVRWWRRIRR